MVDAKDRGIPINASYIVKMEMEKIKIKSVMRLILFLIAFSCCTFCAGRKTKQDMLEIYSVLKKTDLSGFSWWRIFERGDRITFEMYYEQKDSTLYQYTSSGASYLCQSMVGCGFILMKALIHYI
jgi:hypothetical protein